MKTSRTYGLILVLAFIFAAGTALQAQQTEEQLAIEKEIEAAQKAEQEAALRERKEMLEQQKHEQERTMREMERQYAEQARARESSRARTFSSGSGYAHAEPFVAPMMAQGNQAQLTLRNSFRGVSDSSKGEFDVESGTRYFRCMINGKVQSGEILIKVLYPGGKVFKEITITSSAEISFSQSLSIKEGAEEKYIGSWEYEIKADKAEGNYMLQISTN